MNTKRSGVSARVLGLLVTVAGALAFPAPARGADAAQTTFDVNKHGFHFRNGFTGDVLIDVPGVGRVDVGNTSYGLCGGMSYAAYDTYLAGGQTPPDDRAPASGTQLRSYIYGRQDDSFRDENAFMIRRFIQWIPLPIANKEVAGQTVVTGLRTLSNRQFRERIRPALEAGKPVVLGLVKADVNDVTRLGQKNALFINHQVLAIGYESHAAGEEHWDIHIYDPNFPGEVHTLHLVPGGTRYQTQKGQTVRTGSFRGLFRIPYRQKRPYWVASVPTPQQFPEPQPKKPRRR